MNPVEHNTQKNENPQVSFIADEEIELGAYEYQNCCRINVL